MSKIHSKRWLQKYKCFKWQSWSV